MTDQIVRYEQQIALLGELFVSTKKTKNGHLKLRQIEKNYDYHEKTGDKTVIHRDAIYLRLRVPYTMGIGAESLLLAILKLIGKKGILFIEDPIQMPLILLDPQDYATKKNAGFAMTTEWMLLKESRISDGGHDYDQMRLYLEQMSEIRIYYENKATGWRGGDWFLRYAAQEEGNMMIQINWRLAGAIFGEYLYAEIDLDERHALKKDSSKTLHRWLSAHLWSGKSGHLLYETLARHVWIDEPSTQAMRKRLSRLRKEILPEIAQLPGWAVECGKNGATITRKKRG
jgi:hypothetical protein